MSTHVRFSMFVYSCAARNDELSTEDRSILGGIYARSCIAFFLKGDLKSAENAGKPYM